MEKKLTQNEKDALAKLEKELGTGVLIGDVPIIGETKPKKLKKVTALGKWVVCIPSKQKEKTDSGLLYLPKKDESMGHLVVESVGEDVTRVKKGDMVLAPGKHAEQDSETGQIWIMCPEDLIVCIMEEVV